jgi:hypothetical protein
MLRPTLDCIDWIDGVCAIAIAFLFLSRLLAMLNGNGRGADGV